ncbi:pigment defective [Chlorella sorokiniana]|uniref:Methionyl-tRNA formyltransferase, mitochondrial n=1 Tax=Chlorella sorokiniana TaxID=3076 RepID=A0A2P6TSS6_CHLSO|nr:pigment defective [Chlorella sorokiniana]|eukprot:PRW57094.1 pigment defective [Chlorella sorokiniana]
MNPATACGAGRLLPRLLPRAAGSAPAQPLHLAGALLRLQQGAAAAAAAAAARRSAVRCSSSSSSGSAEPSPSAAAAAADEKKRVVFCGTPEVAALVLQRLLTAAAAPDSTFEVAAVVTQPPRPTGRGNRKVPQPSPVQAAAAAAGLPADRILAPEKPGDPAFLAALRQLAPDLCITAAYGNYLPSSFLAVPPQGTLNIHPSLLPAYRGAAPVQRSLQDGVPVSGVTVLYTVKAMDAGPILAQQKLPVDPEIQAPELLQRLFELGTDLLVKNLEVVWAGMGPLVAQPQNDAAATHAAKLTREEAVLDFSQPAAVCHNKVRAFVPWPGTFATFAMVEPSSSSNGSSSENSGGGAETVELKIVRTRVGQPSSWQGSSEREVAATKDALLIRCADGSVLEVLELQAPGKRAMAARDFVNGLKGRSLVWQPLQAPAGVPA